MRFSILIFFAFVTTEAFGVSCPEPDGSILPIEHFCKKMECAPFVSLPSRGCFETRQYTRVNWAFSVAPLIKDDKVKVIRLHEAASNLTEYINGDNKDDVNMESTGPLALRVRVTNKVGFTKTQFAYYIPSKYQDSPPEPKSRKVKVRRSSYDVIYVKAIPTPATVSLDDRDKIVATYNAFKKELNEANVYDAFWKYPLVLAYFTEAETPIRIEMAVIRKPVKSPDPLHKVCKSEEMPTNLECLKADSVATLDGSDGLVQIIKPSKAVILSTETKDSDFKEGLERLRRYVGGANEDKARVDILLPVAAYHEFGLNYTTQTVAYILKDGPADANPKPDDDMVQIEVVQDLKLYVLPFGGKVKDYKEIYQIYFQKLCDILDSVGVEYRKDAFIALEYNRQRSKYKRHEVAVYALD